MENIAAAAPPIFSLSVDKGTLAHVPAHAGRVYTASNLEVSKEGVIQFNGIDSIVTYPVSEWPELRLDGAYTLHIRARFSGGEAEQFVLGRYGLNFLTAPAGWPQGNFCARPGLLVPANSRASCHPDRFYDVLMRFAPGTDSKRADTLIEVYDVETGFLVGRSHPLPRSFDQIPLGHGNCQFLLGHAGHYAAFKGQIQRLSIWNQWLEIKPPVDGTRQSIGPTSTTIHPDQHKGNVYAGQRWREWLRSRRNFPIAAWGYFHRYAATLGEYKVYRDANLTMVMSPLGSAERAEQADLDTIIGLWEDNGEYAELYKHPARLQAYLAFAREKLRRCAGYMLADEPRFNGPGIAELAPGFREIYERDNTALPMVNLMTYAYNMGGGFGRYIDEVIKTNHPPFLVADSYVLYADGRSNDDQFYANTEIVRQKAFAAGIGFMGFLLVTGHRRQFPEHSFRTASESDLHWQANTLLAHGAHGLWYYNYRITGEGFSAAMVTGDEGHPTAVYHQIRELNAGILAIGELLMSLQCRQVFHVRDTEEFLPEFSREYSPGVITGLGQITGGDLIVSEFSVFDGSADSPRYLMIVNKRHAADTATLAPELQITATLETETTYELEPIEPNTLINQVGSVHRVKFGGGGRGLFRITSMGA